MTRAEELAGLWSGVAHVARERVACLEQAAAALAAGAPDAGRRRAAALEEAEKLVGSLDSFGLTGGSALAQRVAALLADEHAPPAGLQDAVRALRDLVGPAPG